MDASDREWGELLESGRSKVEITLSLAACTAVRDPDRYGVSVRGCGDRPAANGIVVRVCRCAWVVIKKQVGCSSNKIIGTVCLSTSSEARLVVCCISSVHLTVLARLKRRSIDNGRAPDGSRKSDKRKQLESEHCIDEEGLLIFGRARDVNHDLFLCRRMRSKLSRSQIFYTSGFSILERFEPGESTRVLDARTSSQ